MRRLRRGPEIWDCEPVFEVGAEVVHPPDREHDVHSELWELLASSRE